jgi:hypothetical protein
LDGISTSKGAKADKRAVKVESNKERQETIDQWGQIRERTYTEGAKDLKRLPAVLRKVSKAALLCKDMGAAASDASETDHMFAGLKERKGTVSFTCNLSCCRLLTRAETTGIGGRSFKQLESTGWNAQQVCTLECLGLVDNETIKNLTRSFWIEV